MKSRFARRGLAILLFLSCLPLSAQNPYDEHAKAMYAGAQMKYSVENLSKMRFDQWQTNFRQELKDRLGITTIEEQTRGFVPTARQKDSEDIGFATRQRWVITVEPGVDVPFMVVIPKEREEKAPLLLTPHGHSNNPERAAGVYIDSLDRAKGEAGERNIAIQAAEHGFIAIAPTERGFGQTRHPKDIEKNVKSSCLDLSLKDELVGRTPLGDRIWDLMKMTDWALENLPVDGKNIIVTGNSGGGTVSIYAGAIDTRISMSLPGSSFCDFETSIGLLDHCACNYIPGILNLGDMGEIAGLTAPRAFCAIQGVKDDLFPIGGARKAFEVTKKIYEIAGAPENCFLYEGDQGHRYYKQGAWDFILSHLDGVKENKNANTLPAWEEGMLDLHFISTGSGNCSFCILPDGTTMLVDAGDLGRPDARAPKRKPDESRSVGEWIVDYIEQFSPFGKDTRLDYALVTHYHDDHIGTVQNAHGHHPQGGYALSGLTEVGTLLPIGKLVDRGDDFTREGDKEMANYRSFISYCCSHAGMTYEKAKVGSTSQVSLLKDPDKYPGFKVRILFASGQVAHKTKEKVASSKFKEGDKPDENNLSLGFRLDYGPFRFYSGGDIPGIGHTGATDPQSMECRVAPLIGPVDVAVLNHHGNRDTQCAEFCAALSPRVWIGETWGIRHPGEEVIRRISSKYVYPGDRDIYATYMAPACKEFMSRYTAAYTSTEGHIVVRVAPGGESYDVFVLDDTTPGRKIVLSKHYTTR